MEILEGLDSLLKTFWFVAIPSSLIFIIQTILTFTGADTADGIDADFDGDAFAPTLSPTWREVQREAHVAANGLPFSFVTYQQ